MPSLALRIQSNSDTEPHEVRVEIPDAEWQILTLFVEYTVQLGRTRLVQDEAGVQYSAYFSAANGFTVRSTMPPEDDVSAFLHRMRPFVLHDEPTAFLRICGILSRRLYHSDLRLFVKKQKDQYAGREIESIVQITSNGVPLNSEDTLLKWLNAYEYHRDRDKQQYLAAIHKLLPVESSKVLFVSMMIEKAKAVFTIAGLIRYLGGVGADTLELQL